MKLTANRVMGMAVLCGKNTRWPQNRHGRSETGVMLTVLLMLGFFLPVETAVELVASVGREMDPLLYIEYRTCFSNHMNNLRADRRLFTRSFAERWKSGFICSRDEKIDQFLLQRRKKMALT